MERMNGAIMRRLGVSRRDLFLSADQPAKRLRGIDSDRAEAACAHAVSIGALSAKSLGSILDNNLGGKPKGPSTADLLLFHANNGEILANPLEKGTLVTEIAMLAARDSAHADHHHHPQSCLAAMTTDGLIV